MTRTTRRVLVLLLLLLALLGWLAFRSLQVYRGLQDARDALSGVPTSLDADTGARLLALEGEASESIGDARSAANDPVFWLAAHIPVAGRSFALARGAVEVSETVVDEVLSPTAAAVTAFQGQPLVTGGKVDLRLLEGLQEPLREAARASAEARRTAEDLPSRLVPARLLAERRTLVEQADRLDDALATASTAVQLAPDMLGASGPRRYFVAVQNNAEARGTGGLVGAYAVVRADRGTITRERVGTDDDFRPAPGPVVDLGDEYNAHYDPYRSREDWRAAVITPEWPKAAATLAGLWTRQSRQSVDGVIGLDPHVMADLLAVTGPVETAGRTLSGGDVVDFVLRDQYAEFATRPELRKPVLAQLAAGIFDKVVSGQGSGSALIRAMSASASGGHLQLWSSVPAEQDVIDRSVLAGRLPDARSSLHVSSVNAAGSKLDTYVRRTIGYTRVDDGQAVASVTLLNTVDGKAVPDFVKSRIDKFGFNPTITGLDGSTKQIITLYGGFEQDLFEATVNGRPARFDYGIESGHPYATTTVELEPGAPVRVEVTFSDPGGTLVYRQQPLAVDDTLELTVPFRLQD